MSNKGRRKQFDWFPMSRKDAEKFRTVCPRGEYRVVPTSEIQFAPLPKALTDKYDHVFIAASGVANTTTEFYMLNGARVDSKDKAIDYMPFGFAFVGDDPLPSGCLMQHANHAGRTIRPPDEFWNYIEASGVGHCFPLSGLPAKPSGRLAELDAAGHKQAFGDLIGEIKVSFP
jgi:hypothetical protein